MNSELINALLSEDLQKFLQQHEHNDARELVLKHKTIFGVPASVVAAQLSGRRKAKDKLPHYYTERDVIYPPGLNVEQSSSTATAAYKVSLLRSALTNANRFIDLTGGLGVDSFAMSRWFKEGIYVEPNEELVAVARHNHMVLGAENISHVISGAEDFLDRHHEQVDLVYIDPSRRNDASKLVGLQDCLPDVTGLLAKIFSISPCLLVKASPLLDIKAALKDLPSTRRVVALAVNNEVKELLFFVEKDFSGEALIEAINLRGNDTEQLAFYSEEETAAQIHFADPQKYLFEPNTAILKVGAFKLIAQRFGLSKLHPSTHFYTSDILIDNFPGRIFLLGEPIKPDAKVASRNIPEGQANIISRNHPLSVDALAAKIKIRQGGSRYVLAFSGRNQKFIYLATRIK